MSTKQYKPPHPGGFIKRCYISRTNIGIAEMSKMLGVDQSTLNDLIDEKSSVSEEMAVKLEALGRSPESWLQMQSDYDRWNAMPCIH